jgi:hypothetical protein
MYCSSWPLHCITIGTYIHTMRQTPAMKLNSIKILEALKDPTPGNQYLRDQYQYRYPTYNRLAKKGKELPDKVKAVHDGHISIYHCQTYGGYNVPIKWYCNDCGHVWHQTPQMVITAKLGCPECAKHRPRKKLVRATQDEVQRAIELHSSGSSVKAIAEALGRAPGTIQRWLNPESRDKCNAYMRARYQASK